MKNKKNKISIIIPALTPGGAERVHIYLANSWVNKGYSVNFILMKKKGELIELLSKEVEVYDANVNRIRFFIFPLIKLLRKIKPDIIITAMWPLTSLSVVSLFFARKKSKLLLVEHSKLSGPYAEDLKVNMFLLKMIMKFTYTFAHKIICVSEGVKNDLLNITNLNKEKFKVIYNPVKKNFISNLDLSYQNNVFGDCKFKLLGVGTLKTQKDFATLVKAFSILPKNLNAKLIIIGEGPEKNNIKKLIFGLKLESSVLLIGYQSNTYPWFQAADLYIHSAIYDGMPLTIIESLACGTPVVSTNSDCGPAEILDSGRYGKLVNVKDPTALSQAIYQSLFEKHNKNDLIKRSEFFSIDKISNEYIKQF